MAIITCLGLRISGPKNLYQRGSSTEQITKFDIIEPEKAVHSIKHGDTIYDTELSISNLTVDRGVGKHCQAEAKMNLTVLKYDNIKKTPPLSVVTGCFANCRADIFACTYDDGKDQNKKGEVKELFMVAENYYVIDTTMECEVVSMSASEKRLNVILTLKLASWDYFMDRNPYCKVFVNKQLGAQVMTEMVNGHNQEWKVVTNGIQNIYCEKKTGSNPDTYTRLELHQPYLVQFNETEYQFLLRNANRCGEFLFFENGKLNYGLSSNVDGKTTVNQQLDNYNSVKSLNSASSFDIESEYFQHNGTNYASDTRKPGSVTKERPFVAEYANDEYFRPFKANDYDSYYEEVAGAENFDVTGIKTPARFIGEKWAHYSWKMVNIILSHQDSVGKMVEDCLTLGTDALGLPQKRAAEDNNKRYDKAYFDKDKIEKNKAQYSEKAEFHSQFSELYTDETLSDKYGTEVAKFANKDGYKVSVTSRPSTDLFFRMGEKEKKVASMKYVLTYNGLVDVHLGEILNLASISPELFVVVDVRCVSGINDNVRSNKTIVTVVPGIKDPEVRFYPLPAGVDLYRKSGSQTARVVDNADPLFQGRVRIKYLWQKDPDKVDDASPWIRVTYPYATKGSGIYSKLTVGDEVMVDYVNENIELPYVSGSVFGMDNKVPFNDRTYSQVIRSANGHMIGVTEEGTTRNFFKGILPVLPMFNFIIKKAGADNPASGNFFRKLIGGVVIRDTYGFYEIKASSDERKISISSPYGNVNIDAFTGITLSAPNGDINIKGKNVNIVANNNLTLKSGENIENALIFNKRKSDSLMPTLNKLATKAIDAVAGKFLDVQYLRSIFETFLRPVEGTLEIKSNRYLLVNAGKGNATVPVSAYASVTEVEECEKDLYNKINALTFWQRDCADVLAKYYHAMYELRMGVMSDFKYWRDSKIFIKKRHDNFAANCLRDKEGAPVDDDVLTKTIDDHMQGTKAIQVPADMPKTKQKLERLKSEYTAFWEVTEDSGCFSEKEVKEKKFYQALAKIILNTSGEDLKLFKYPDRGFMLKPKLLKQGKGKEIANLMRTSAVGIVQGELTNADESNWEQKVNGLIKKLQNDVTESKKEFEGYMPFDKALMKTLKDKTLLRFKKSYDARMAWQPDAMGGVLISQEKGKTISFNGAVVQENENSSVEQLRTLLLSPPFTNKIPENLGSDNEKIDKKVADDLKVMIDKELPKEKEAVCEMFKIFDEPDDEDSGGGKGCILINDIILDDKL